MNEHPLGQLLVDMGVIDADELAAAVRRQQSTGHRLGRCLVDLAFCDERAIVRALSRQRAVVSVKISSREIDARIIGLVDARQARTLQVLPLAHTIGETGSTLTVAMSNPWDMEAIDALELTTRMRVVACLAGDRDLEAAIERHYPRGPSLLEPFGSVFDDHGDGAPAVTAGVGSVDGEEPVAVDLKVNAHAYRAPWAWG